MSEQTSRPVTLPARISPVVLRQRVADPQHHDSGGEDVSIRDILHVLYRRRWLILGVVCACVAAAQVYNQTATPQYEARARLLIAPNSSRVVPFRPVVEDEQANLEYYQTQYEVLRSRALASKVLDKLTARSAAASTPAAAETPERAAEVGALLGRLQVTPVKGSRLVDVSYTSEDPAYAARAANTWLEAYIEDKNEMRLEASRQASEWLIEQLSTLRKQVDTTQSTLQDYRERKDAVSLDDRQNIVVQKLAQLSQALTAARTDRISKEAVYNQLHAIQQSGGTLDSFSPIASNAFIQKLKGELATLQRERTELAQHLGELHPDMIRVDTAIAAAEERLDSEIRKAVDGIRNDLRSAQANERGLMAALEGQKREVLDLNRKSIEYGALQRDASSTQQMFESVLQRVKEADLSADLQTNTARILDRAEVPTAPVWPRAQLNLAIALFGGMIFALGLVMGLEYLAPRLKTPGEVGHALGLPLLGITPRVARLKQIVETSGSDLPLALREALRGLRARILLSPSTADIRALAVTSTSSGEGKTLIASNLAVSMASTGRRVLLVDADMRRPQLHRLFEIPRSPGLSDVLSGSALVSTAVHESSVRGLFVLAAGTPSDSPGDLLDTDRFKSMIRELTEVFDLVVLDSPPVMVSADAAIIANAATAGLFVIGAGVTSRDAAGIAVDRLAAAQAQVIGVVLNKADPGAHGYADYAYREDGDIRAYAQNQSRDSEPVEAVTAD